jgi:hypothetical protein
MPLPICPAFLAAYGFWVVVPTDIPLVLTTLSLVFLLDLLHPRLINCSLGQVSDLLQQAIGNPLEDLGSILSVIDIRSENGS